jgi:poly-gamma-glutamate synthesis protein (capsule biosynthesis protein)
MDEDRIPGTLTLFLAGDVMLGRGVDQILPHPCDPKIYETYATSALDYLRLAERRHGPIQVPVPFDYVWGDGMAELSRRRPDFRLVNLETAVTRSNTAEPKGINYRMSPENVPTLTAAQIQACALANNHVLDWGQQGLYDTLQSLEQAGIGAVGAGRNLSEATLPHVRDIVDKGRVIIMAFGSQTSGIPASWAATKDGAGINLLPDETDRGIAGVVDGILRIKQPRDVVVVSIHWGGNWGYDIPSARRKLAHRLIEEADVDLVFGHSSHHPKAIELYRGKLILYGCGDLINDYEGISGHENFRGDLSLMYFPRIAVTNGRLEALDMVTFRTRSMRLVRGDEDDARWLAGVLKRECARFGTGIVLGPDNVMHLTWD